MKRLREAAKEAKLIHPNQRATQEQLEGLIFNNLGGEYLEELKEGGRPEDILGTWDGLEAMLEHWAAPAIREIDYEECDSSGVAGPVCHIDPELIREKEEEQEHYRQTAIAATEDYFRMLAIPRPDSVQWLLSLVRARLYRATSH